MAESQISNFNLAAFQAQLGNITQSNNFAANITLPAGLAGQLPDSDRFLRKIPFAIRAAELPPSVISEISVPFRAGTKFRIPGDRDFTATWSVTARFDIDSVIYNSFESWSDAIVGNVNADTLGSDDDVLSLMGQGDLYQLSRNGRIIKQWSLANIWIQTLGAISYDWSADNTIVEVPVTFVFSHKESDVTRNNVISEQSLLSGTVVF
jgi:hypothetical protein